VSARLLLALAVAAAVLPATAAGSIPPPYGVVQPKAPPSTPLVQLGAQLYAGNCSICHGPNGIGFVHAPTVHIGNSVLGRGPDLRGVGEQAPDFYLRTGRMPLGSIEDEPSRATPVFSDHQIRALVAYVGSLAPGPAIPHPHPEEGRVNKGLRLFTDHCAGCHQVVAEGGYVTGGIAPELKEVTPTQIAEAVRIGPYVMPTFSEKALSDSELDDIIAYIQYAKSPRDEGGWDLGHIGPIPEGLVAWLLASAVIVAFCVVLAKRLKG
jgi:ubiquinol-cytochrome c reductase cytochrome c subunit